MSCTVLGGGWLATRTALVHTGQVVRPVLEVDTGSVYTLVEPTYYHHRCLSLPGCPPDDEYLLKVDMWYINIGYE